jgi:hypothetical protein
MTCSRETLFCRALVKLAHFLNIEFFRRQRKFLGISTYVKGRQQEPRIHPYRTFSNSQTSPRCGSLFDHGNNFLLSYH